VHHPAARGVDHQGVTCRVEGNIDLRGILGIDPDVRNGFSDITVTFEVSADNDTEGIVALIDQSRARSAVFDVLTNGTRVDVRVVGR
jgi:OsmC-like protein